MLANRSHILVSDSQQPSMKILRAFSKDQMQVWIILCSTSIWKQAWAYVIQCYVR